MKDTLKKFLTAMLIIVVAVGAAVGGWLLYKEYESRAAVGKVTMKLDPKSKTVSKGQTISAKVMLENLGGKKIQGARFKLKYDNSAFNATEVDTAKSDFGLFPNIDDALNEKGYVKLEASIGGGTPITKDSALIAIVQLKAIKKTSPSRDNTTFVADKDKTAVFEWLGGGKKQNVLGVREGATYAVSEGEVPGEAKLSFLPTSTKRNVGSTFNAEIRLDTAGEDVSSVAIFLGYDPVDSFRVTLSKKGSVFSNFLREEISGGIVSFNAGGSKRVKSSNALVATLKVKGTKKVTPTADNFVFDEGKCKVGKYVGPGNVVNILGSVKNGRYTITTVGVQEKPETPIELKGEAGNTVIKWTWKWNPRADAVSNQLAGFKLYVGTESGKYGGPIDIGEKYTYTSTGLTNDTTHYAVVKAYNANGVLSNPSNEASATPSGSKQWGGPGQPSEPSTGGIFNMPSSLIATGIVIGSALLVALIISIVIWALARKRKKVK